MTDAMDVFRIRIIIRLQSLHKLGLTVDMSSSLPSFLYMGSAPQVFIIHVFHSCASSLCTPVFCMFDCITSRFPTFVLPMIV